MTRINMADYFVLFSSIQMTPIVQAEIAHAYKQWNDKSKIIVVYDKVVGGKNLVNTEQCTEILIDTNQQSLETIAHKIMGAINTKQNSDIKKIAQSNKTKDEIIAFLGIGAGLLLACLLMAAKAAATFVGAAMLADPTSCRPRTSSGFPRAPTRRTGRNN